MNDDTHERFDLSARRFGADRHVDSEGYLQPGRAQAHAESVTVVCRTEDER